MAFDTKNLGFKIAAQVVGSDQVKALNRDVTGLRNSAEGITSSFKKATNAIKTLAAGFVAREIFQFTKGIIDLGDELNKTSQKLGIGAKTLSNLKVAAELSDVPFDALEKGLKKISVTVVEASTGSKEAQGAFRALGVQVKNTDGSLKSSDRVISDIADKFAMMKDGAEKAAIAQKIFGKSGADLIPLLNQGSSALSKYGLQFGDDFPQRSEIFNDSITLLGLKLKQFGVDAVEGLLPSLQRIVNGFDDLFSDNNREKNVAFFTVVGQSVKDFTFATLAAFKALKSGFLILETGFQYSGVKIGKYLEDARDFYSTIFDVVSGKSKEKSGAYGQRQQARENLLKGKERGLIASNFLDLQKEADELTRFYSKLYTGSDAVKPNKSGTGSARISELSATKSVIQTLKDKQALDIQLLELENRKIFLSEEAYEKEKRNIQFNYDIRKATAGLIPEEAAQYRALSEAHQREAENLRMIKDAQENAYGVGAISAIKNYVSEASKSAKLIENVFKGAFNKLEDSLVEFVKTGKFNFKDLADFIVTEMIRISVKQAVIAPILGAIGGIFAGGVSGGSGGGSSSAAAFEKGGIMSSRGAVNLRTYSRGGIANSPQLALFGEGSRPEAYVPLPDGRRIPVSMSGSTQGGDNQVSVTVNIDSTGSEKSIESNAQFGDRLGKIISNAVKQELILQARPGGMLAGGMT